MTKADNVTTIFRKTGMKEVEMLRLLVESFMEEGNIHWKNGDNVII